MTLDNESAKALSSLLPELYGDVVKPSAQEVGHALQTIFKIGLAPISLLDWGFTQSKDWLAAKFQARIAAIPEEFVVAPRQSIAYLALTNIAANHDQPELRELFAELLLKAIDRRYAPFVHPAYFPTLAQLSPEEALVFIGLPRLSDARAERRQGDSVFVEIRRQHSAYHEPTIEMQFSKHCQSIGLLDLAKHAIWLDNLQRLSLVQIDRLSDVTYSESEGGWGRAQVISTDYRYLGITDFGRGFLAATTPAATSMPRPDK